MGLERSKHGPVHPSRRRSILTEGFQDGFAHIERLARTPRVSTDLAGPDQLFYSSLAELRPTWLQSFNVEDEWHLGAYDYLTRVVYPLMAAPDEAGTTRCSANGPPGSAAAFNAESFRELSRMRAFLPRKR
jgi:hypothetical protein